MATDRTIDVAKALHLQGRTAEAENLYRELLENDPHALAALEGLGVLVFQRGNAQEASRLFARGVAIDPSSARFHANLGEALRTIQRLDEALDHLRKAAALDPTDVQAWNSLGLVAFDASRYPAAEHAYREAIRLRPRFVHAHINLANTLVALGRSGEAADALRKALSIEPNNAIALVNLARVLSEMRSPGLLPEAESCARRAVALAPRFALGLRTLAKVFRLQGRPDLATDVDQRAQALEALGPAANHDGLIRHETRVAVEPRPAPSAHASPAQMQSTKGLAHLAEGQLDQAERALREALRLDPAIISAWVALATVQAQRGDFDLSCESARAALAVRNDAAEAYWRLASNLLGRLPDIEVAAMEALAADDSLSNDDRAHLHFGLAMVLDRRRLYGQASAHHDLGNLHQSAGKAARGLTHDPDRHSWFIDQVIAGFTADFLARGRGWGVSDPRPVFVVGFPRSGTTLVEQIVASHPQVAGAGELLELHYVFQSLPALIGFSAASTFEVLPYLGPVSVKAAAARYLAKLNELAPATAARVIDKMPDNVIQLGLIALLFPDAKVIVCHRDPRDIAVSCWQTGFRTSTWNNDWDHIARRLADHQRIVRHWRTIQPLTYLDLRYEDLVAEPERHARALIEYVGLGWDPVCLDFHSSGAVVRTPSLVQVRQPIHSGSSGRWRHYEATLQPMFQAFERHGVVVETTE